MNYRKGRSYLKSLGKQYLHCKGTYVLRTCLHNKDGHAIFFGNNQYRVIFTTNNNRDKQ